MRLLEGAERAVSENLRGHKEKMHRVLLGMMQYDGCCGVGGLVETYTDTCNPSTTFIAEIHARGDGVKMHS